MTTSAQDKLPLPVELPSVAPDQDSTPAQVDGLAFARLYGEPPFTKPAVHKSEVCLGCVTIPRRGAGSAPGDTEATTSAQVHAAGDSGSGGAEGSLDDSLAPERQVSVRGDE